MVLSLTYMMSFALSIFFSERLMERSSIVSGLLFGVGILFWGLFLNSIPVGDI